MINNRGNKELCQEDEKLPLICANCGCEICKDYYVIGDNWLQTHYFEGRDYSVFCSKDCIIEFLSTLVVNFETGEEYTIHRSYKEKNR